MEHQPVIPETFPAAGLIVCAQCGHNWPCPVRQREIAAGAPPPLEDDRVAMMLGLVPDKRTPEERLWDAVRTSGTCLRAD